MTRFDYACNFDDIYAILCCHDCCIWFWWFGIYV